MGESAGAMAVGNLLNTFPENPPFRAAVMMSGSSVAAPQGVTDYSAATEQWTELMRLINCTGTGSEEELECARSADAETIVEAINLNSITFSGSSPDNSTVLERPDIAWANGEVAKVPTMIGSTADDASYFAMSALEQVDESILDELGVGGSFRELFNLTTEEAAILDLAYSPGSPFTEGANTTAGIISQVGTDVTFRCTSGFVANLTANLLQQPTWQYVFDAMVPSNTWSQWPELGVYHASEIALVFATYPRDNTTEVEAALSRSMQKQFADFIKDPETGPGWEEWPKIGVLGVDESGPVTTNEDTEERDAVCAYWNAVYLQSLPALAAVSGNGSSDRNSEQDSDSETGNDDESAAVRPELHTAVVCVSILLIVMSA